MMGGQVGQGVVAETDFSLGGGGLDEFQLKRMMYNNSSMRGVGGGGGPMMMMVGDSGGSLGMKQKRKRKLATDWPPPPTTMGATTMGFDEYPTVLMRGEGEMELERSSRRGGGQDQGALEETLLGLDGRMMGYPPPPIFVNQHHHHLHHHLHTHTHYGAGGGQVVEAPGGMVSRGKGGLYQ